MTTQPNATSEIQEEEITFEQARELCLSAAKATDAENKFLSRIAHWLQRGVKVKIIKHSSNVFGVTLYASFYISSRHHTRGVFLNWTLNLPRYATRPLTLKRNKTAVRFFGKIDKKKVGEQEAAITAGIYLETHK